MFIRPIKTCTVFLIGLGRIKKTVWKFYILTDLFCKFWGRISNFRRDFTFQQTFSAKLDRVETFQSHPKWWKMTYVTAFLFCQAGKFVVRNFLFLVFVLIMFTFFTICLHLFSIFWPYFSTLVLFGLKNMVKMSQIYMLVSKYLS